MRLIGIEGKRMQLEREADQSRVWVDRHRCQDLDCGYAITCQDLDWGYAITAHRGHGLTADAALISGDPSAWAQLLYTLATRQREQIRFYGVDEPQMSVPTRRCRPSRCPGLEGAAAHLVPGHAAGLPTLGACDNVSRLPAGR